MTLQDRLGAPAYAERYGGLVRDFHTMVKDQPPPKDWIILGLLIRARHLVLAGQAGSLKTMLLWQLCVQLIQDRPDEFPHDLGILPPRAENAAPAKVAIVDGEMGPEQYHERAWDTGLKDYVLRGRLKYIDAGRLDIVNPDDCEYLMEELDGYDLVILDSLKGLTPSAAENDNDEMASVVKSITQMARALNAGIATIHHWGKEDAYRGASAILDQCDAMVAWKKHNPKNDDGYRCLSARGRHQKIRFAKEPQIAGSGSSRAGC